MDHIAWTPLWQALGNQQHWTLWMSQDVLWNSLGKVALYTGRRKGLGGLVSSVQKGRSTESCLLCSFLRIPHTFQQDTATALTEALAPSWGAGSSVTLQVFSEWTALHRNHSSTAGDLLTLLSNGNFGRKVVRYKLKKLRFMINGQAHK